MSLQWMIIATFLYAELIVCGLLMLPFISPQRWQKIFRSRLLASIERHAQIYYSVFLGILVIVFLDAIREVVKYSSEEVVEEAKHNPLAENAVHMKLFRAQRNFYIAGISVFMYLVIRKFVVSISRQATLMAECEASRRQAEGATEAAKALLDEQSKKPGDKPKETAAAEEKLRQELDTSRKEVTRLTEELKKSQHSTEAMKKQSEGLHKEYDRLSEEYSRLQKKVDQLSGAGGDKKCD